MAYVLGIWDGHDSGAALIEDGKILFAANEERYTKRKLEIKFPYNAISNALDFAGIKPTDVETIAFPTTELTKTISRVFPGQKEAYYKFRRRKIQKPAMEKFMHYYKYATTTVGVLPLCDAISRGMVEKQLKHIGFSKFKLYSIDHHMSHAATAAFTSGMEHAIVITLDGLGDGLSGSISILENGKLERKVMIPARDSIGIFYEQVTNLVGMRELEDEGKVMAMADYSFPFPFEENKMKDFYKVEGLQIKAKYGPVKQYQMLDKLLWTMPREQFAYMAQQVIENIESGLVANAINHFGIDTVVFAGGIMSNVKANMRIRNLDSLKNWYIFPHMGDGGIALGAAMCAEYMTKGTHAYEFDNAYLGNSYNEDRILQSLKQEANLSYEIDKGRFGHAAELIDNDEYVFWFNGRMEYGPRALGDRSILANAGSDTVKEKLNTYVKQREWYQPFAPSILRDDAEQLLENVKGKDRFMTMAYAIQKDKKEIMKSVVHVDLTARPQMVGEENKDYMSLIKAVKDRTGFGVVLNTSFNIHGSPIVASPEDALLTMKKTKTRYMFLGEYFVENKEAAK